MMDGGDVTEHFTMDPEEVCPFADEDMTLKRKNQHEFLWVGKDESKKRTKWTNSHVQICGTMYHGIENAQDAEKMGKISEVEGLCKFQSSMQTNSIESGSARVQFGNKEMEKHMLQIDTVEMDVDDENRPYIQDAMDKKVKETEAQVDKSEFHICSPIGVFYHQPWI
ncbi:hypothetical protein KP509_18G027900 [Ceratopteris richardii]|uniref:Uncharacterized protein n=1 Tax=Ceratopteris richardii TaxID=49495 RepID=A0A8T2SQG1_CERRI|nr:hypothetical protein KP509_18G027900 [Ceratopteris richardii]